MSGEFNSCFNLGNAFHFENHHPTVKRPRIRTTRGLIIDVRNRVGYNSVLGLFSETKKCHMKKDESHTAAPSDTS